MKKKNGFTLIELLAVIVILAIIALIATPIILGIVEDAKRDAFLRSVELVVSTTDMDISTKTYESTYMYKITDGDISNLDIPVKNTKGMNGSVKYDKKGNTAYAVYNEKYCVVKEYSGQSIIKDYDEDCSYTDYVEDSCFKLKVNTDNISASITDYLCTEDKIIIPEKVNGMNIVSIGQFAFRQNNLTSVEIPNSVTSIGDSAFYWNQLTSVTIPSSVTSIENDAFAHNQLTSVTIPSSVRSIGNSAFETNQLTSVEIPNSVTSIGNYAFKSNQLTSVEIPNSVTSIGAGAFNNNQLPDEQAFIYARRSDGSIDNSTLVSYGGAKRENVEIPSSVTSIGDSAFYNNRLTSIVIPSSVTSIGDSAFRQNNLTSVEIPNSVTSIGQGAFYNNQLTSVEIPNSVTYIGSSAFYSNQLTSVTIPNSVTSIEGLAFYKNQLTSVEIPNSVTSIGSGAFSDNQLTSIEIPSNVTNIGAGAFNSNRLTSVTIPSSVISIENSAFANNQLTSVTIIGKSSTSDFTSYGRGVFGWAPGYSDSNITFVRPYVNGQRVYFDVVKGIGCTMEEYASSYDSTISDYRNSLTGYNGVNKTGNQNSCLLFYAFNDEGGTTVNLLLDHNTTASDYWTNSSTSSNANGPITVLNDLKTATSSWNGTITPANYSVVQTGYGNYTIPYQTEGYKARLITAQEIAKITGADKKAGLLFNESTTSTDKWFNFDSLTQNSNNTCQNGNATGCQYGWLYDRTSKTCKNDGCYNNADAGMTGFGYWTATSVYGSSGPTWFVYNSGLLVYYAPNTTSGGVRPVITVLKSKISPGEAPTHN